MKDNMITGIGIDILKIDYISQMLRKYGNDFLKIHFSPMEIQMFKNKKRFGNQFLGGRFAAKEAFFKAISAYSGIELEFCDIEIINDSTGKPELKFTKHEPMFTQEDTIWLSISHHREYAVAQVIIERSGFEIACSKMGVVR